MWLFKNAYFLYVNQTSPERAMEVAISKLGTRYRCQHLFPGLRHIADFALLDRQIIIEVDGKSHSKPDQIYKDLVNTLALEKRGWRVLRCSNDDVSSDAEGTLQRLLTHGITARLTIPEIEARLQDPDLLAALSPPKKTKRKPGPPRRAKPRRRARKVED